MCVKMNPNAFGPGLFSLQNTLTGLPWQSSHQDSVKKKKKLAIQWLRLCASTARGLDPTCHVVLTKKKNKSTY